MAQWVALQLPCHVGHPPGPVTVSCESPLVDQFLGGPTRLALSTVSATERSKTNASSPHRPSAFPRLLRGCATLSVLPAPNTEPQARTHVPVVEGNVRYANDVLLRVRRRKRTREVVAVEIAGHVHRSVEFVSPASFCYRKTDARISRGTLPPTLQPDTQLKVTPYAFECVVPTKDRTQRLPRQLVVADPEAPPPHARSPVAAAFLNDILSAQQRIALEDLFADTPAVTTAQCVRQVSALPAFASMGTDGVKGAIRASVYSYATGPFGRLLLRLGFDPADPVNAAVAARQQRIAFRFVASAPLLRDMAHFTTFDAVVAALSNDAAAPPCFVSLLASRRQFALLSCDVLYQLPATAEILQSGRVPLCDRRRTGWYTADCLKRAALVFREAFDAWLLQEVKPLFSDAAIAPSEAASFASPSVWQVPHSPLDSDAEWSDDDPW